MGFSASKRTALKPQKEKALFTFLIALGTAVAVFLPCMLVSRGYFIFYGDFNVQQIPFYQKCHQAVREGNIFWSWTTDLGANFIGSYSFYLLGSPFFWLTLPFPNEFVPYLMGPLLILKFACAALTAYCYIRRFTRTPMAASLGGLLYAFSGFSVYNIFFNHFHEAIIVFPILLLALELLLTENKRCVFALAVCLSCLVNYFFFFGMVVFTAIYFFVRLFSGAIKVRFSRFAVLVFEAVLGLALSAGMLLPSILAITGNYRVSSILLGWNALMYGREQIYGNVLQCFFFPPDIPARPVFFPNANVQWSSLGGWLPVFSMVGVFVWFAERKGHWLKRVIGICIFMALVPVLNSAFYAFNTAYYARWFYMPILMMCLATVVLTEDETVNWSCGYRWVLGITAAVSLVIGLFPKKDENEELVFGLYSNRNDWTYTARFWITCAIAISGLVILGLLLRTLRKNAAVFYRLSVVFVCIFSIGYANFFIMLGHMLSYDVDNVMIGQLIEGKVDLEDKSEFRVDVYDGVDNTSMYLGLPGINAFHSIVPASVFDFYKDIGMPRSVGSRPETDYSAIRPLLSVKYLLNRKDGKSFIDEETKETAMPGYQYKKTSGGYRIYENTNYVPYGFSYEYYMTRDFLESYTNNDRAAMMLKAIYLTKKQVEKYGSLMKNIEELGYSYYEEEQTSLSLSDEAMAYDCEQLRKTAAVSFERDNDGFSATVNREKEALIFFSVPYDEGWSATVNGKPAEIEKVNVGFMAVLVDKGTSNIRFTYRTPGLVTGLKITAGSCIVLAVYLLLYAICRKKMTDKTVYPEGDELLRVWRDQDVREMKRRITQRISEMPSHSLMDEDEISIPHIEPDFKNGFQIDRSLFDGESDNE